MFLGFDFHIKYNAGKENLDANGPSRSFMLAWYEPKSKFIEKLTKEVN